MFSKTFSLPIITLSFTTLIWISPAAADTFKPLKYLQDASVVSAIATAVSQLSTCEEDLVFSEQKKKDEGGEGEIMVITVDCSKLPNEQGKMERSVVRVELEINEDGSIGAPVGFLYE